MTKTSKSIQYLGIILGLTLTSGAAISDNAHYIGVSYVSGATDVWNWHEDNLNLLDEGVGIPIGVSYRFAKIFDSGMRFDAGVGPVVLILGDIEYHDIPFQLSFGYSFSQSSDVRPYVRLGASFHSNSGDYLKDKAGVGAVGAVGMEIGRPGSPSFFVEAAVDTSEATFSTSQSNSYMVTHASEEDIAVSEFLLTMGVRF